MRNPTATLINVKREKTPFYPMLELDEDVRLFIEKRIDSALTGPSIETDLQLYLCDMGIESNLETKLSLITGMIIGSTLGLFVAEAFVTKGEVMEIFDKEGGVFIKAVLELLARRAMELRLHFSMSAHL